MPTPADGRRELLTVIAYTRTVRGKHEELKAALEALIEPTKHECSATGRSCSAWPPGPGRSPAARQRS